MTEIIGFIAAFLSTICFIPQVLRVIKTKHTKSISLPMYVILILGAVLWVCYGFLTGGLPVIIANSLIALLAGIILFTKIRHG